MDHHMTSVENSTRQDDCAEIAQGDAELAQLCMLPEKVSQLQIIPDLVTSPNSLPPELLVLIFEHTVDTSAAANNHLVHITHVCRYWRDVALHSPALWTHIALKRSDAIKTFLKRSQGLPLYNFVNVTSADVANPMHAFNQVVQVFLAEYGRTSSLKVRLPPSHAFDFVMKRIANTTSQIEKLSIERLPPDPRAFPEDRPAHFDGVPRLRSLTLAGEFLPWLPKGPNALTEIDLTNALHDARTLVDLLHCSPSLERVTIRGTFNERARNDKRRVILARLKSLRTQCYPARGIGALLPSLVLPSKHTEVSLLAVCPWPYRDEGAFSALIPAYGAQSLHYALLQGLRRVELSWDYRGQALRAYRSNDVDDRAGPALEVMAPSYGSSDERWLVHWPFDASRVETVTTFGDFLRWDILPRERWWGMLAVVPALKVLRVKALGRKMLDGLIQELALGPQPLCSQLQTLALKDVTLEKASWKALMDVVASRAPAAGGCLSNVELSLKGPVVQWDEPTSSAIREAGVELVMTTSV